MRGDDPARFVGVTALILAAILVVLPISSAGGLVPAGRAGPSQATSDAGWASATPAGQVITLVPSPHAYSIVGSSRTPTPPPVTTGNAFVTPDLYNAAPGGAGSVILSDQGPQQPFQASVNFSNVVPQHEGVVGYPEIQYGAKPWCPVSPCVGPPLSNGLALPIPLFQLPVIDATAQYSASTPANRAPTPFDIAFDLWLTRAPHQSSAGRGDVEAMLWLYHSDPSILPGTPMGERTVSYPGAGSSGGLSWDVYVQHPTRSDGPSHWTIVYLVLPSPPSAARVQLDMGALLRAVESVLTDGFPYSWSTWGFPGTENPATLYLNDIELGSEFLPASNRSGGPAQYVWQSSQYSLYVSPSVSPSSPLNLGGGWFGATLGPSGPGLLWVLTSSIGSAFLGGVLGRWPAIAPVGTRSRRDSRFRTAGSADRPWTPIPLSRARGKEPYRAR